MTTPENADQPAAEPTTGEATSPDAAADTVAGGAEVRGGWIVLPDGSQVGVVTVDGSPPDVTGLMRAIVVALSTAIWSDQPRVVAVGFEPTLERLPGVESTPTLSDALLLAEVLDYAPQTKR